jgi:hypothetical protein
MESTTFTMVEVRDSKSSKVSVRPYFDNSVSNMGLESYGLSVKQATNKSGELINKLEINKGQFYPLDKVQTTTVEEIINNLNLNNLLN